MSRNLVLARAGRNSLHPRWIDARRPRDWDLVVVPYQHVEPQPELSCVVTDVIPGPKLAGLRRLLKDWDGWRDYDLVWMPDDDIDADHATISRMFEVAGAMGLDLFAPALHRSSYYAHFNTMENPRFHGRWVGFVEIMMPGFSRAGLERLLPTFDMTQTGWGWGLDSLWPKLLDYQSVGIIDATPVIHTRPVGQMRDSDLFARVRAESDRIMAENDCHQVHATFGAFGPALTALRLSGGELLDELVRGYGYLIDRDPRILGWITSFQRGERPDYPVAGTPEGRGIVNAA
jgi:hypothetical protein